MSPHGSPGAVVSGAAGDSTGDNGSVTRGRAAGKSDPETKWRRVLRALTARPSLHRFTAETDPAIRDHVLPSTISDIQRDKGLRVSRRLICLPGHGGAPAYVAEYFLDPAEREKALRVLERGR